MFKNYKKMLYFDMVNFDRQENATICKMAKLLAELNSRCIFLTERIYSFLNIISIIRFLLFPSIYS